MSKLRAAIQLAVDEGDVEAIIAKLVSMAREGDLTAAREILDRTVGKAAQSDLLERVKALEAAAERLSDRGQSRTFNGDSIGSMRRSIVNPATVSNHARRAALRGTRSDPGDFISSLSQTMQPTAIVSRAVARLIQTPAGRLSLPRSSG